MVGQRSRHLAAVVTSAVVLGGLVACGEAPGPPAPRERIRAAAPAPTTSTPTSEPPAEDELVVTVPTGRGPSRPAVGLGHLWVPSIGNGTLTVVDPASGRVVASVDLDDRPDEQRFRSWPWRAVVGDDAVWVSDRRAGTVVRVDAGSREVTHRVPVPEVADIVLDEAGDVWAVTSFPATLVRIDGATGAVTARLPFDGDPPRTAVALDSGAGAVWVATTSRTRAALVKIDPATATVVADVTIDSPTPDDAVEDIAATEQGVWLSLPVQDQLAYLPSDGIDDADPLLVDVPGGEALRTLEADGADLWGTTNGALARLDARTGEVLAVFLPVTGRDLVHPARGDGGTWVTDPVNHAVHFVPDALLTPLEP